mgnify:CR=1 FL=1
MKTESEMEALARHIDRVLPLMGTVLIALAYIIPIAQFAGVA